MIALHKIKEYVITVKLTHGLTYNGKVVSELRLKPLTVGGELAAFALIDDLPERPGKRHKSRTAATRRPRDADLLVAAD